MTEKEMIATALDEYMRLQSINSAEDMKKEVEYQIKALEMKLATLGVANLDNLKK